MADTLINHREPYSSTGAPQIAGGVVVILAMGWLKGDAVGFASALWFLLALLAAAIVAAVFVREKKRV